MKKLLIASILMVVSYHSFSQTGFKTGLNLSTNMDTKNGVWYDYKDTREYRTGFYVGAFTTVSILKKLALQPELLFSLKGSKIISHPADGHPERKLNLYYLNLPLLLSFKPIPKLSFVAGPEIGFLLKATTKNENQQRIVYSDFNNIDLGAAVGVNFKIIPALSAELRYTHGFTSIADSEQATNKTFQVGLTYQFNKKKNSL